MASLAAARWCLAISLIFTALQSGAAATKLCFERVYDGSPLNLVGHPANANYALVGDQAGHISLIQLPAVGKKVAAKVLVSSWLDLSSRALYSGERGLLSFAFHPKFLNNGRFFVSYICDSTKHKDCQGPCSCNANIGCKVGDQGAGCNSNTVIAEYHVSSPHNVLSKPSTKEAKRILTYARLFSNHNGGDIFFGLGGLLYITSGDGGSAGDPFGTAQNPKTFLGKVLRINIDATSRGKNYSIPADNPFKGRSDAYPEIFSLGHRNPWRCSVDSDTNYAAIVCGDVGQDRVEEVDIIKLGHNYGWSRFEGTTGYNSARKITLGTLTSPTFQYAHPGVSISGIPQDGYCVIGGQVYRAKQRNTCLQGKYIFNDLGGKLFIGTIYPTAGKKPSFSIATSACASSSPYSCSGGLGQMWAWGVDGHKDVYVLSSSGAFRLTDLSRCGQKC